jgi:hypothetical protein
MSYRWIVAALTILYNTFCLSHQWRLTIALCNRRGNAVGGELLLEHHGSISTYPGR